jgi:hypothetical protein
VPKRFLTFAAAVLLLHLAPAAPAAAGPAPGAAPAANVDGELVRMGREIPGFGGLFYDAEGYPTVYLLDPRDRAALSALKSLGSEVRVRRGDFGFAQLVAWRDALLPALASPGVVFLDADEARNRVVVGLDSTSPTHGPDRDGLERRLAAAAVPRQAVLVVDTTPVQPLVGLQSKLRPVPGGVQILFPVAPPTYGACTLGFNAYRGRVFGFVINSHCTGVRGAVDGMRYYQSLPPDGTIGTEIADPAYFTDGCPAGRRCRFSDAAFARYDKPRLGALARIARPSSNGSESGSLTLKAAGARFTITGGIDSPLTGDVVHKVGRTSGWTYGTVVATCAAINVSGTDVTELCQSMVRGGSGPGDSGSPVFYRTGKSPKVKLAGILWGGGSDANVGTFYVFSPLASIEQELGPLKIH